MKAYIFFGFILVGLVFGSCGSSGESQEAAAEKGKITSLYVRYMEKEKKIKGIAEFKDTDSTGKIIPDASAYKIWFQGRAMQSLAEYTGKNYYDLELDHAQPGVFEFTVEDSLGNVAAYPIELQMPGAISVEGFKKEAGLMVNLDKLILKEGEDIVVVITDQGDQSVSTIIKGPSNGKVLITQESFNQMQEGPCTLYFVWKTAEQKPQTNGRLLILEREYFMQELTAELTK